MPVIPAATSPGTKWVAFNAIAEHLDYGRRYTARSNQVQRSFEDASLKQRALELICAA
jgi:elongation factor P hydroxylase